MKTIYICLIFTFSFLTTYSQISPKQEIARLRKQIEETKKDINWEEFDTSSKVSVDKIQIELLQGEWKAYNGLFSFFNLFTQSCNFLFRTYLRIRCQKAESEN